MTAQHLSKLLLKRDKQVLDYLLSIADSEGNLTDSTYAIAHDLGIHRQILSRILSRLARTGAVTLDNHACRPIRVTGDVTGDVTSDVTDDVTQSMSQSATDDAASTSYRIGSWSVTYAIFSVPKYASENAENDTLVTGAVTSVVTSAVTNKKETKQQNEEISPAPPKEEKNKKKKKAQPITRARAKKFRRKSTIYRSRCDANTSSTHSYPTPNAMDRR